MKLVYLGTSGAMPTVKRGLSCTVLVLDHEYIMIDCGDGTCRQYIKSSLGWNKPLTILITHMHSDHTMGILGLLQSMDLMGRTEPIIIYGIKGIKQFVLDIHRGVKTKFGFKFEVHEFEGKLEGLVLSGNTKGNVHIKICKSQHQVPSLAYKIILPDKEGKLDIDKCLLLGIDRNSPNLGKLKRGEDVFNIPSQTTIKSKDVVSEPQKGLTIAFSGDTRPTPELEKFFRDVDYLTYEATFLEEEKDLALKTKHSTAYEAGLIANKAGVKHTILNHFSARHNTTQPLYDEASKVNPNIMIAKDFLEIELD